MLDINKDIATTEKQDNKTTEKQNYIMAEETQIFYEDLRMEQQEQM